ncbi:unnamed protein product [Orchesella dallaii]|uniref:Biogenesis of lysosome-related organelles complex 1 subunit 4 n=1 Tax=Orchesella dallaii TaxID=48710 RepID=A0ABP1Q2R7_9HEXA
MMEEVQLQSENGGPTTKVIMSSSSFTSQKASNMSRDKSSGIHGEKRISSSKIQPSSASSMELLTKMAVQYSVYCQTDLSAQISRLEEYLQESIAKLEEQQSLFEIKEIETREWTQVILPQLVKQAQFMSITLSKRMDSLNELIVSIKLVLDQLEKQISIAEQKLGLYPSPSSFRSVFKYFMKVENSPTQTTDSPEANGWETVKEQFTCEDPLNLTTFLK